MTLYEINAEIAALVDPETGEVADWDAFDALSMSRTEKLENIACFIKDLDGDVAKIKAEESALAARRKITQNKADGLRRYLAHNLAGEKFETARCKVTFRKTSSVAVDDEAYLKAWLADNGYEDCLKYRAPEISKSELGKLLKDNAEIPGCRIESVESMQVK